ncbi:MAG: hypothetical protein GX558_12670, partial [Clostridiales bacterium]|nr:hypothetical protein [Clostridiales bacterium]
MRGWLKAAVAALIASIAWIAANMAWPNLADWYARAVYPTLLAIAGGASARIAMPAAEVLALLLALLFAASTLAAPLRALFTRSLRPLKVWLVRMLCGLAAAIALYAALWAP